MSNTPLLELSSLPKWNTVEITEASTENLIHHNVFLHGPKRKLQMNERNSLKNPKQKQVSLLSTRRLFLVTRGI